MSSCFIIAEAGVNHNGSLKLALELIDQAAYVGADAVKFQSFKAEQLVSESAKTAEYQRTNTGLSDQLTMLKKLEMSVEFHQALMERCQEKNIDFMSTPFDIESAQYLVSGGMKNLKVPSGELTNIPFLKQLAALNKPMILSTGMATLDEVSDAVEAIRFERENLKLSGSLDQVLTILHCTSNYPANHEDVNLLAMMTMGKEFGVPIGYSDHTDGLVVPLAAVSMGAKVLEKHFTLDCGMEGPDHKASLEPDQFAEMVRQVRQVETCFGDGIKAPRPSELSVRSLVRRSVTLKADMSANQKITESDVCLLRPGSGVLPKDIHKVIGKRLKKDTKEGTQITFQDLIDA